MLKKIVFVAFALLPAPPLSAAPFAYVWPLQELAKAEGETVELRDDKGRILKRVNRNQLLYIHSVVRAIKEAADLDAQVLILDGDQPNAFATKGRAQVVPQEGENAGADRTVVLGKPVEDESLAPDQNTIEVNVIAINFAMLDMLGLDVHMMAALVGHELAHLKLNHGEDQEKHRGSASIRTAAATRYSRDNEREADYLGVIWSVEAGYDPAGAVRLQEMLYQRTRFQGGAFVGSHPSSTERIAILKSLARRLSKQ